GIEVTKRYSPASPEFSGRSTYVCPSGHTKVDGGWSPIVPKGITLDAEAVTREGFTREYSSPHPYLEAFRVTLFSYSKEGNPSWVRDKEVLHHHCRPNKAQWRLGASNRCSGENVLALVV
ncbi:hypothetical protein FRC08_015540, partial [Ceratobasidium sp. 394]